jgi:hypothetical protein
LTTPSTSTLITTSAITWTTSSTNRTSTTSSRTFQLPLRPPH